MSESATSAIPHFILEGNGSFFNRGCEAIFQSTVSSLREEFGSCYIVNAPSASSQPDGFYDPDPLITHLLLPQRKPVRRWSGDWWRQQYNVRLRPLGMARRHFLPYLNETTAVLSLGGDNYSLDYGLPTAFFDTAELVLKKGKPFVLWGATVGPFTKNPAFEKAAVKTLEKMTMICARETATMDYLKTLGIKENVRLVADPAFLLQPTRPDTALADWVENNAVIGVNLSPLLSRFFASHTAWLVQAEACLEALLEKVDLPVLLIPHVVPEIPSVSDHTFLKSIKDSLSHYGERLQIAEPVYNAGQLKWLISQLEIFAGARTHATIAAFSSGVPTLCIAYSMKARGLANDIYGHLDWFLPVGELSPAEFARKMELLLDSAESVKQRFVTVIPPQKVLARSAATYLRQVVAI